MSGAPNDRGTAASDDHKSTTAVEKQEPFMKLTLLVLLSAAAFAQEPASQGTITDQLQTGPPAATGFSGTFLLGSGAGFKPYQTTIRAGSSAFVEAGWQFARGMFVFPRVDMRSTDAQMVIEGCKSLVARPYTLALLCGGPGFGANASNLGLSLAAGGKLFFSPKALQRANTWLGIEMGVAKTTVPAPVSPDSVVVNPVQPEFRVGIFRIF
jgi:hypothetical protein